MLNRKTKRQTHYICQEETDIKRSESKEKLKKEETKSINVLDHDHTIEEETDFKRSENKEKLLSPS